MVPPLRDYRDAAKLTQRGLAERLGVSRTTVARWELGIRKPDRDLLQRIAAETGIPVKELRPDLAELMAEPAE